MSDGRFSTSTTLLFPGMRLGLPITPLSLVVVAVGRAVLLFDYGYLSPRMFSMLSMREPEPFLVADVVATLVISILVN